MVAFRSVDGSRDGRWSSRRQQAGYGVQVVFSSTVFLFLFLPVVLGLYFLVRPGLRNGVLLVASLAYYAWGESTFVRLLLYATLGNHLLGLAIQRLRDPLARQLVLGLAVLTNLGLLVWFKYANFAVSTANALLTLLHSKHPPLAFTPVIFRRRPSS